MDECDYRLLLSKKLRELRSERHLSLNQMARIIGINLNVYARWESGKSTPTVFSLKKIQTTLELKWDDLLP